MGVLLQIVVGPEPTVLAVDAGGGCLDIFLSLSYLLSGRRLVNRLKYRLNSHYTQNKQPTNHIRSGPRLGQQISISLNYSEINRRLCIGVGRFRILGGGPRFRILGGPRGSKFPAGT